MREIQVKAARVNNTELFSFGEITGSSDLLLPDSQGEGWQCWYPLGVVPGEGEIGLVRSTLTEPLIEFVECHPTRSEWVYAIDKPIIQVVALSDSKSGSADPATTKAVLLKPGDGIIIQEGVWHAPAFSAD